MVPLDAGDDLPQRDAAGHRRAVRPDVSEGHRAPVRPTHARPRPRDRRLQSPQRRSAATYRTSPLVGLRSSPGLGTAVPVPRCTDSDDADAEDQYARGVRQTELIRAARPTRGASSKTYGTTRPTSCYETAGRSTFARFVPTTATGWSSTSIA